MNKKGKRGKVKKLAGENGEDVSSNLHTIHLGELVRKGFFGEKDFGSSNTKTENLKTLYLI